MRGPPQRPTPRTSSLPPSSPPLACPPWTVRRSSLPCRLVHPLHPPRPSAPSPPPPPPPLHLPLRAPQLRPPAPPRLTPTLVSSPSLARPHVPRSATGGRRCAVPRPRRTPSSWRFVASSRFVRQSSRAPPVRCIPPPRTGSFLALLYPFPPFPLFLTSSTPRSCSSGACHQARAMHDTAAHTGHFLATLVPAPRPTRLDGARHVRPRGQAALRAGG